MTEERASLGESMSLSAVEIYYPVIVLKRPLLAFLLALLRALEAPTCLINDALKALFGVTLYPLNRPPLIKLGALPKHGRIFVITLTGDNKHSLDHNLIASVHSALTHARSESSSFGAGINVVTSVDASAGGKWRWRRKKKRRRRRLRNNRQGPRRP
ncbi:uncharacterized protein LOC109719704 [Ananas comosus]|uniref:Uncharacterized protein LOC109719704 n=1 Tax=Ananas comosus TaxID=4615 RepID=A0A6P5G9Y0_ANACO|nr:uncharacterized protein LOC109719704 [Ananas comosus]